MSSASQLDPAEIYRLPRDRHYSPMLWGRYCATTGAKHELQVIFWEGSTATFTWPESGIYEVPPPIAATIRHHVLDGHGRQGDFDLKPLQTAGQALLDAADDLFYALRVSGLSLRQRIMDFANLDDLLASCEGTPVLSSVRETEMEPRWQKLEALGRALTELEFRVFEETDERLQ